MPHSPLSVAHTHKGCLYSSCYRHFTENRKWVLLRGLPAELTWWPLQLTHCQALKKSRTAPRCVRCVAPPCAENDKDG